MPCIDLFEDQSTEYKETVLPSSVTKRVSVEALSTFGWGRYTGLNGKNIGMTTFGASSPAENLFPHFGITTEAVVEAMKSL